MSVPGLHGGASGTGQWGDTARDGGMRKGDGVRAAVAVVAKTERGCGRRGVKILAMDLGDGFLPSWPSTGHLGPFGIKWFLYEHVTLTSQANPGASVQVLGWGHAQKA